MDECNTFVSMSFSQLQQRRTLNVLQLICASHWQFHHSNGNWGSDNIRSYLPYHTGKKRKNKNKLAMRRKLCTVRWYFQKQWPLLICMENWTQNISSFSDRCIHKLRLTVWLTQPWKKKYLYSASQTGPLWLFAWLSYILQGQLEPPVLAGHHHLWQQCAFKDKDFKHNIDFCRGFNLIHGLISSIFYYT